MVFCGKPSLACGECRLRRTKCDTRRPSCSQCLRAGRTCHGYRDPTDLMFRDESQNPRLKRKQRNNNGGGKESYTSPKEHSPSNTSRELPITVSVVPLKQTSSYIIPNSLWPRAEDQAISFFFHNYVLQQTGLFNGGYQYLQDIFGKEPIEFELANSLTALGMVGLSNFWKSPTLMNEAHVKYTTSLRDVSSKLARTKEAKSDQVLIAVMMLGLYETNTCSNRNSMEAWTKHINGAAALLQFRGKEQLQTALGYQVFVHLRTQIITNCMQRHAVVPQIFTDWATELTFESPEQASSTTLSNLAINYCALRASMSSFDDFTNSAHILAEAYILDDCYATWADVCPSRNFYTTALLKEGVEDVFSDFYHLYPSIWSATAWNNYRCARILVNELILHQLEYVNSCSYESSKYHLDSLSIQAQILKSNSILLQLCNEICASVPYFLNVDPASPNTETRPLKSVNGNLLLWPLYTAGVTPMVSDMMRNWVAGRLQWISDFMGIRQAGSLALALKRKQDISDWQLEEVGE